MSQAAHAGVTLDMYYWGVFRDSPSNRGKPRSRASLREYDGQMDNYISPVLGSTDISKITHDMMRSCSCIGERIFTVIASCIKPLPGILAGEGLMLMACR